MFNSAVKLELGLAVAALLLAMGGLAIDDRAGAILLGGIFLAALLAGLALIGSGTVDRARRFGPGAPPLEEVSVDPSSAPRPSPWPLMMALAAGILAVGLAVGRVVVTVGVFAALMAAAGWLAQCWREDPGFTIRERSKLTDRLIAPVGLPLLALSLIAVIVISVSRVLLAVPKDASIAIAGSMAVLLMAAFFFLSTRPRIARNGLAALAGFAIVSVAAAGSVSAASGYRTFEHPAASPQGIVIQAQGIQYKQKQITVKASEVARITFENMDSGTYHNIAVYTKAQGGSPIWNGEPIRGVAKITYAHIFTQPGKYSFRCDFHPTAMLGTFTVEAG